MKIEKFLNCVQSKLLYHADIDFPTLKLFLDKFVKHLSKREYTRWQITIEIIMEFTSKQISIDKFVSDAITESLEIEINNLKNGVKPK